MRRFITVFFFLIGFIDFGWSQDSAASLSPAMFNSEQVIYLSEFRGWIFKPGHDTSPAQNDLSTAGWIQLNPTELSAKFADDKGRVEGWFRFKFKLDPGFANMNVGLRRGGWAATDLYVDGALLGSFGRTGYNEKDFVEYNPIDKQATPVILEAGKEHIIAIHFVDYLSPLPPRKLKSATSDFVRRETMGLGSILMLTGPQHDSLTQKFSRQTLFYRSIWLAVTLLLSLLFWLLFLLNPGERKTLLLIAIYSSISALSSLTRFFLTDTKISFVAWEVNGLLQVLCAWLVIVITFVLTTTILNFKIHQNFRRFLIGFIFLGVMAVLFGFGKLFTTISVIVALVVIIYILVSRWKKLKGAQWAIVGGLLLSILFITLLTVIYVLLSRNQRSFFLLTCFYLSFPLSLMVYVSLRFREIIREVREHADQVVQMTQEKKEQAENQQKILEEEVARQTSELRSTLDHLKSTQQQLIHSEKMASLGELTAGIAHEIQNPLNFVNNFSEVSRELLDEMKTELDKGEGEEAKLIADDVKQNLEKILHHGKRADAIVKGMLQHSRGSSAQKEATDINALADEYLRLAYHGLRAKDKSFNASFHTDFDNRIQKINVMPQDIGRVILNLINNAFYAVTEKRKEMADGYEPSVTVSTKKLDNKLELRVIDNGNGIPEKVREKIFQPFFTTKPTGEGTGLGLSLSYDIITKGHGGELRVETKEGEGSTFIIQLPNQD